MQVSSEGWIETLDKAMIKEIVEYRDGQLPAATGEDYFDRKKAL